MTDYEYTDIEYKDYAVMPPAAPLELEDEQVAREIQRFSRQMEHRIIFAATGHPPESFFVWLLRAGYFVDEPGNGSHGAREATYD